MSDNFTPLPSIGNSSSVRSSITTKQAIGGVLTLGLLVAIGSGVFLINQTQTSGTKAYSTDQCIGQGGFEWASTCPPNTQDVGIIESSTQSTGLGDAGTTSTSTGGNHVCCVPNGEQTKPTSPAAQIETPVQSQITQPPPDITNPPSQNPSCKLPQPVLSITCPNGCVTPSQQ